MCFLKTDTGEPSRMLESAEYIDQNVDLLTPAQIEESLHAVAVGSEVHT